MLASAQQGRSDIECDAKNPIARRQRPIVESCAYEEEVNNRREEEDDYHEIVSGQYFRMSSATEGGRSSVSGHP